MRTSADHDHRAGIAGAVETIATWWAIAGGLLLLAVILVNVISIVGGIFWKPFPGDFELTEMGVAVVAFSFLPFCQLTGANVTADIFTSRATPRWIALFKLLASLVAIGFALLLIWRMSAGMLSQRQYGYTTAILQLPIWKAYVPALVSLALLIVAGIVTLAESGREFVQRRHV
ncbi:MAG: TRAP transporter small permease [Rhodobacteraceae bacterium]|nr:TRAP transporter small permease [Paracoccaceae bacterium]